MLRAGGISGVSDLPQKGHDARTPTLPFVIAFILAGNLEQSFRQAFAVSGGDPWFLFKSPMSLIFLVMISYLSPG